MNNIIHIIFENPNLFFSCFIAGVILLISCLVAGIILCFLFALTIFSTGITLCFFILITKAILYIVIHSFHLLKRTYCSYKMEKGILRIYKLYIKDKNRIISEEIYLKDFNYYFEFWKWDNRISNELQDKLISKDLLISPTLCATLKEYELWRKNNHIVI